MLYIHIQFNFILLNRRVNGNSKFDHKVYQVKLYEKVDIIDGTNGKHLSIYKGISTPKR